MATGTLVAATNLHKQLLLSIMRSPLGFFDTTPLGRILNRFSKDVDVMDNTLPLNLSSMLMMLFSVIFFCQAAVIDFYY